jgi:hypothetical protein
MSVLVKRISLLLSLVILTFTINAQVPRMALPELAEGKKILYLNEQLLPCDSAKAIYFCDTYFHLSIDVWSGKHPWRKKGYKIETSQTSKGTPGLPVALNGTFKYFSANFEKLMAQEEYRDGKSFGQTITFDKKQNIDELWDFSRHWENTEYSFYHEKWHRGRREKSGYEYYDLAKHHWITICIEGCYISKDLR